MAEERTAILNTDGGSLQTSYYPLLKTKLKKYIALVNFCQVLRTISTEIPFLKQRYNLRNYFPQNQTIY